MPQTTVDVGADQTVRRTTTTTVSGRPQKAVTSTSIKSFRNRTGTAGGGGNNEPMTTITTADLSSNGTPSMWARFNITPNSLRIATASSFATDAELNAAMACVPDLTPEHTITAEWDLSAATMELSAPPSTSDLPFSVRVAGETVTMAGPPVAAPAAATALSAPSVETSSSDAAYAAPPAPVPQRVTVPKKVTVAAAMVAAPAPVAADGQNQAQVKKHLAHLEEELKSVKAALMQQTEAVAEARHAAMTAGAENTRLKAEITILKQQQQLTATAKATPPPRDRGVGALPTTADQSFTAIDAELKALRTRRLSRMLSNQAKALAQASALWDVTVADTKQSGVTVFEIAITDRAGAATKNVTKRYSQLLHLAGQAEAKVPTSENAHKLFQKRSRGTTERREMLQAYFKTAFTAPDLASYWMAML